MQTQIEEEKPEIKCSSCFFLNPMQYCSVHDKQLVDIFIVDCPEYQRKLSVKDYIETERKNKNG